MQKFFCLFVLIFLFSFRCVFSQNLDENQLSIKADYIKSDGEISKISGNVIVRKSDALLNADSLILLKNDDNLTIETDKYIKIRMEDGTFIYGKSLFYNKNKDFAKIRDIQIFPGSLRTMKIFAPLLEKNKEEYIIDKAFISLCTSEDSILEEDRKLDLMNINDEIKISFSKNILNNDPRIIEKNITSDPLSLATSKLKYDSKNEIASINNGIFKIFGIPFFYLPKFSIHTNKKDGDSGFLLPRYIGMGLRQMGVEIPFYWRIRNDMDLVITRTQFLELQNPRINPLYGTNPAANILDTRRLMEETTGISFRHLVSDKNEYSSYYQLEGLMTDKTFLIDQSTGLGIIGSNGKLMTGYRGYFELQSKMRFSKTTYFNLDYLYTTDRNFLFIYKMDYRPYKINTLSLYDVDDRHYYGIDLLQFQSLLMPLQTSAMPIIMPIVRLEYEMKKDKFGGNFYFKSNSSTIQRNSGFDHSRFTLDAGYTIPYIAENGFKITLDSMIRGQYDQFSASNIGTNIISPGQTQNFAFNNQFPFIFGNYQALMQNLNYWNGTDLNGMLIRGLNFNKIQIEKPYIIESIFGTTILEPKIAFRYSPNDGRQFFAPNDDGLGVKLTQYNAFSLIQTGAFGTYDFGGSIIYGGDVTHKFENGLEMQFGTAQSNRIIGDSMIFLLPEISGFAYSKSDTLSYFLIKKDSYQFLVNSRFDNYRHHFREINSFLSTSNQYFTIGFGYNKLAREATIYSRGMDILTVFGTIYPHKKIEINFSGGYNLSDETTPLYPNGNTGFTFYSIGVLYVTNCIKYGLMITQNNMTIGGIPPITRYRFVIQFNGF